jgi:4-hydroxybenzoate polyprenyltransferase
LKKGFFFREKIMQLSIKHYFSLIKISHTVFSLPFAILAFFMAINQNAAEFSLLLLGLIILAVFFARSAAMSFNRFVDRNFDRDNPRTSMREIPSGKITPKQAFFLILLNSIAFICTAYFINKLCFFLSPIALVVIFSYSFMKRITPFTHLVLGLALGLASLGAYLAVNPVVDGKIILLSLGVLLWVAAFDIIYALQDIKIDKKQNLHSIPAAYGFSIAILLSRLMHFFSIILLGSLSFFMHTGIFFWIGLAFFSLFLIIQHLRIKKDDFSNINFLFFTYNGLASIIFCLFVIIDIFCF